MKMFILIVLPFIVAGIDGIDSIFDEHEFRDILFNKPQIMIENAVQQNIQNNDTLKMLQCLTDPYLPSDCLVSAFVAFEKIHIMGFDQIIYEYQHKLSNFTYLHQLSRVMTTNKGILLYLPNFPIQFSAEKTNAVSVFGSPLDVFLRHISNMSLTPKS